MQPVYIEPNKKIKQQWAKVYNDPDVILCGQRALDEKKKKDKRDKKRSKNYGRAKMLIKYKGLQGGCRENG